MLLIKKIIFYSLLLLVSNNVKSNDENIKKAIINQDKKYLKELIENNYLLNNNIQDYVFLAENHLGNCKKFESKWGLKNFFNGIKGCIALGLAGVAFKGLNLSLKLPDNRAYSIPCALAGAYLSYQSLSDFKSAFYNQDNLIDHYQKLENAKEIKKLFQEFHKTQIITLSSLE